MLNTQQPSIYFSDAQARPAREVSVNPSQVMHVMQDGYDVDGAKHSPIA